jgi:outer membrane protein assembly factor BamB
MVAADRKGNVVAFNKQGQEVWENRVSGHPPETMQVGDINADGILDIVFGTTTGFVWALSGATGALLPKFPVKTGEIRAPVLLAQLR